jgi:predicted SprT family Zn-dependent metalloprotease
MTLGSADQLALLPYGDRFFGGAALARSRSYPSDSEPDLFIPFEPYEYQRPLSSVAVRLQDPFLRCDRDLGWNIDWAVAFVVDRLEQNWADTAEKLKSIRIRAATLERDGLVQEIPYHIFNKLDEVLFAGQLKNAIFLDISSLGSDVSGATYTHRLGPNPDVKRISIILNIDALEYAKAKDIVAILIHHMIHAYFLVACGGQKEDEVDYGRLDHNVHFGKIMLTMKKLSAVHGRELSSLNYGYSSPTVRCFADEYYSPRRREVVEREDRERWHCGHCHSNVQGPSESEVQKWYGKVCKPLFDQPRCVREQEVQTYNERRHELETRRRARLRSSAKSVEFMYKDRLVLVDGGKIEEFLSVVKAFDKAGSRFIKVHKEVSEETFVRFLEFIHTGSYRPDPRPFAAAAGLVIERRGPPIIKPQATTSEACVLTDVRFAKLGTLMGFDDCKSYALDRMNAYGTLNEDPVAILEEIYKGYEPDSDLKDWARKFLIKAPNASNPEYHTTSISVTTIEPPNLVKLESQQSSHRARFLDAIDSSGALENDVNKARAELKAAGWYNWSSLLAHDPPRLLTERSMSYSSHPLALGRRWPLLLGRSSTPDPWHSVHDLTNPLSSLDIDRLRTLEREKSRDRERAEKLRDYERVKYSDIEHEKLRQLRREKERELEREKDKLRRLEREKEKVRETHAQLQATAAIEALFGRRGHEFIEDYD